MHVCVQGFRPPEAKHLQRVMTDHEHEDDGNTRSTDEDEPHVTGHRPAAEAAEDIYSSAAVDNISYKPLGGHSAYDAMSSPGAAPAIQPPTTALEAEDTGSTDEDELQDGWV